MTKQSRRPLRRLSPALLERTHAKVCLLGSTEADDGTSHAWVGMVACKGHEWWNLGARLDLLLQNEGDDMINDNDFAETFDVSR